MDPQDEVRRRLESLSEQEWQAFKQVCNGLSYSQIARRMHVVKATVQEYLSRAYVKLGLDRFDNHRQRMQAIKGNYKPVVDQFKERPGKITIRRPTAIVTYTPRVLAMVINDEIDEDNEGDEKDDDKAVEVVDEEIGEIEDTQKTGSSALVPISEFQGLVPYEPDIPKPRQRRLRWFVLGALLMLALGSGAARLTNRMGLWSTPPLSPAQAIIVKTVEVTRQVPFTVTHVVEVSTTPLPTQPPVVQPVPFTVTIPMPYTVTVPVPVTVTPPEPAPTSDVTSTPAPNAPTPTPIPTNSPAPQPGAVGPGDPAQPGKLANNWRWLPGGSTDSTYRVSGDGQAVTLISGAKMNFHGNDATAPLLTYPLSDSARMSLRLEFDPHERFHVAGLALRSRAKPNTWIALRRFSDGFGGQFVEVLQVQDGNAQQVVAVNYAKAAVYLRINRQEDHYTFDLSENGRNWLTLKTDHLFLLPGPMEAVLHVYSTSDNGIDGTFSDLAVSPPVTSPVPQLAGAVAFADPAAPEQLDPMWGYNPGGSVSNAVRVQNGQLVLSTGPRTESYTGRRTAPFVYIPLTGVFTAQVKLAFDPHERFQVAGMGLRSRDEPASVILLHRWSDGFNGQGVGAQRVLDNVTGLGDGAFPGTTVFLRIHRDDPQVTLSYSSDGTTWNDLQTHYVMGFPEPVTLMLYVWSSSDNGIQATFSDLQITR